MAGASAGLLSLEKALETLLQGVEALSPQGSVALSQAYGRVLAEDVFSDLDVPPSDNSAVDGYAISDSVTEGEAGELPVAVTITAGESFVSLPLGTAARIYTGASVPPGTVAVLMQERCEREGDILRFPVGWTKQQNIRPQGQDLRRGEKVLAAGTVLRGVELGLLASIGCSQVRVYRQPRVVFISTGNELVEPGEPLAPGQIYNSNRYLVEALIRHSGCEPVILPRVEDNLEATRSALQQAAELGDVIISTGGVSVGDADFVKTAIRELGHLDLWRLALKPGKPFAFGSVCGKPILGLPGNPSAALITYGLLARPYLLALQGFQGRAPQRQCYPYVGRSIRGAKRREYLRVRLVDRDSTLILEPHPNQSSGMLSSACWADGLAVVCEDQTVNSGDALAFIPLSEWLPM